MEENEKKENKIKNILRITGKIVLNVIYAILAIIIIILIYNIIQMSLLNKPYMDVFGYSFFQVKTGSMSGILEIGDIIIVDLTKDVKENEIITYEKEGNLITHRIIKKDGEKIITKGDANNAEDEAITLSEVIGKVVYVFRNVEIWKNVLKTPEVYTLIIITLVLGGITISIKDKKSE